MAFLMKIRGVLISIGSILQPNATELNPFYSAWLFLPFISLLSERICSRENCQAEGSGMYLTRYRIQGKVYPEKD